jgi:hypothetical protein
VPSSRASLLLRIWQRRHSSTHPSTRHPAAELQPHTPARVPGPCARCRHAAWMGGSGSSSGHSLRQQGSCHSLHPVRTRRHVHEAVAVDVTPSMSLATPASPAAIRAGLSVLPRMQPLFGSARGVRCSTVWSAASSVGLASQGVTAALARRLNQGRAAATAHSSAPMPGCSWPSERCCMLGMNFPQLGASTTQ